MPIAHSCQDGFGDSHQEEILKHQLLDRIASAASTLQVLLDAFEGDAKSPSLIFYSFDGGEGFTSYVSPFVLNCRSKRKKKTP